MVGSEGAGERQVTRGPGGRILTNAGVWSSDSEWIVYDARSDPAGNEFDGETIERVHVRTGEVRQIYRSANGAHCAVATFRPLTNEVAFILGPEHPTPDWSYTAWHRQGVVADCDRPGTTRNLDARDIVPPFTPGALRGGTHVHVWDARGDWLSFTYEDHVLAQRREAGRAVEPNRRNVGVSVPGRRVAVPKSHPRNHDGDLFSVLVTRTVAEPRPGSDEIARACEEGWVGVDGYARPDGTRQRRALAFQGLVAAGQNMYISEVFVADLPEDLTGAGEAPLCGTSTRMPAPPRGVTQWRLTHTAARRHPGLQGPRHWLRSSPDGARIAFLMKDDSGIVQLWTVSPNGGAPAQLTSNQTPIASAFTWSRDGCWIAHAMDNSVCVTDSRSGRTVRLTPRSADAEAPRPEACVFSPDGRKIACVRRVSGVNQVFVTRFEATP